MRANQRQRPRSKQKLDRGRILLEVSTRMGSGGQAGFYLKMKADIELFVPLRL